MSGLSFAPLVVSTVLDPPPQSGKLIISAYSGVTGTQAKYKPGEHFDISRLFWEGGHKSAAVLLCNKLASLKDMLVLNYEPPA